MEKQFYYQMQWPRDNLFISCYAHELFNYRYHWPGRIPTIWKKTM